MNIYRDFLDGFAYGAGIVRGEAGYQWREYSSLMPACYRLEIERRGYGEGIAKGIAFAQWARNNS